MQCQCRKWVSQTLKYAAQKGIFRGWRVVINKLTSGMCSSSPINATHKCICLLLSFYKTCDSSLLENDEIDFCCVWFGFVSFYYRRNIKMEQNTKSMWIPMEQIHPRIDGIGNKTNRMSNAKEKRTEFLLQLRRFDMYSARNGKYKIWKWSNANGATTKFAKIITNHWRPQFMKYTRLRKRRIYLI